MSEKWRIGVIGGGIGRAHIRAYANLADWFEVVAICDIDRDRAREIAEKYDVARVCTDLADLCRMADVDVIDICTPSALHFDHVMQALDGGKHVVCEKPVVGSLQEMDALIRAEAASDRRVMPIFQRRFGLGVQKLKFLQQEGLTGPAYLTTAETAWRRRADYYATWHGRWETELGGPLVTLGIHAHDVVYHVLGPAARVAAHTATLVNPIETEDCVTASLEMVDGSLASLSVTVGSAAEITRHRFCFSNLVAESNTRAYSNTGAPWTFTGRHPTSRDPDRRPRLAGADHGHLPRCRDGPGRRVAYPQRPPHIRRLARLRDQGVFE